MRTAIIGCNVALPCSVLLRESYVSRLCEMEPTLTLTKRGKLGRPSPTFGHAGREKKFSAMSETELIATAGQWFYVCCYCMVHIDTGSGVTSTGPNCVVCHNTNLRFVHVLEHVDEDRQIQVGIECARRLVDPSDWETPRLAENETKRKERWRIHYKNPGRCVTTVEDLEKRGKL